MAPSWELFLSKQIFVEIFVQITVVMSSF